MGQRLWGCERLSLPCSAWGSAPTSHALHLVVGGLPQPHGDLTVLLLHPLLCPGGTSLSTMSNMKSGEPLRPPQAHDTPAAAPGEGHYLTRVEKRRTDFAKEKEKQSRTGCRISHPTGGLHRARGVVTKWKVRQRDHICCTW